jgi:hypothetical protein
MFRSTSETSQWAKGIVSVLSGSMALAWASIAGAQTTQVTTTTPTPPPVVAQPAPPATVVVQPAPAPVVATTTTTGAAVASDPVARETREEAYVPNPYLLTTGFILWGGAYTASVIVAAQSSNSADQHLYVPVVGPWIDLGNRGSCPVSSNACNDETSNKVLLILDGAVQAIGTLEVIWGFIRPEHREITTIHATRYTPDIKLTPASVASGYGLTALAQF